MDYKQTAGQYYKLLARTVYGADYINTGTCDELEIAYCNILNNLQSAYLSLKKIKTELQIPFFDFCDTSLFKGFEQNFIITKGKLFGDFEKAKQFADLAMNNSDDLKKEEDFKTFEQALYIQACLRCIEREEKNAEKKSDKLSTNNIASIPAVPDTIVDQQEKAPVKKETQPAATPNIFSMFNATVSNFKLMTN